MTGDVAVAVPGRVNLIGDHTDYTGGLALPIAIDRWTTITGTRSDRIQLRSNDERAVALVPGVEPASGWTRHVHAIAALLAERGGWRGIDGRITTTIPIGAGLSSSAALDLALALACGADIPPHELIALASAAERRATGVPTGLLDQTAIVHAREGHATVIDVASASVAHVPVPPDAEIVVRHVAQRTLAASGYTERVNECAAIEQQIGSLATATLGQLDDIDDDVLRRRARHVITENDRVRSAVDALTSGDLVGFGALMVESHRSLADDYAVSTTAMDDAVASALATRGVLGARMTGGGFGGCIVMLVEPGSEVDGWRVRPVGGPC